MTAVPVEVTPRPLIRTIRQSLTDYSLQYSPELSELLGKDHWITPENYCYFLGQKYSHCWVLIPAGYGSDGATVPYLAQWLFPVWGKFGGAVLLHDRLCATGYYMTLDAQDNVVRVALTRKEVDEIFFEALEVLGITARRLALVKAGVSAYRTLAHPACPNPEPAKAMAEEGLRIKHGMLAATEEDARALLLSQEILAAHESGNYSTLENVVVAQSMP